MGGNRRWYMVDAAAQSPRLPAIQPRSGRNSEMLGRLPAKQYLPETWPEYKRPPEGVPGVGARRVHGASIPADAKSKDYPGVRPTNQAWKPNEKKVRQALHQLGIRVSANKLGCGSYGCAYLGEPYVVKITSDPGEAANAQQVREVGGIEGVIDIKGVFAVEDAPQFYVLLTEPLQPLLQAEAEWVEKHRPDWRLSQYFRGEIDDAKIRRYLLLAAQDAQKKLTPLGTNAGPLIQAGEILNKLGIRYEDGHDGNVMVRVGPNGERTLVYIDLGHSEGPAVEVPYLRSSR